MTLIEDALPIASCIKSVFCGKVFYSPKIDEIFYFIKLNLGYIFG